MVTYVALMNWTDKGVADLKSTTQRAAAAKEIGSRFGVDMREILWTVGAYDMVCIFESNDEQAMTAFALAMAKQGNIRSASMRAWTSAEMDQILAKVPG
ncbi:MAG TPA: GYD domain-containing protein [Rubrivivax sp.]|nr:GYD domain-containing protein [Rubrivivax sp.]HMR70099.1 GYD domain-containing protein [Rubrivivax sp.]